jgi:hypothetical protein
MHGELHPPHPRARRALRVLGRILGITVAVLLLLFSSGLALLDSSWGREKVRGQVQKALDDTFAHGARVGAIEDDLLGDVLLRDVVILDASGQPAVSVSAVRVAYDLVPLVRGQVRISRLTLVDLEVHGRQDADGVWNLTRLLRDKQESTRQLDVRIDDVSIAGAQVVLEPAGRPPVHLDDLAVDAGLVMPDRGHVKLRLDTSGTWREQALPFRLVAAGAVERSPAGLAVVSLASVELRAGEATVSGHDLVLAGETVRGQVKLDVPKEMIARLRPDLPVAADLSISASARPAAAIDGQAAVALDLSGSFDGARLRGQLTLVPKAQRVRGTLTVDALDPSKLLTGAPELLASATVELDLVRAAADWLGVRGRATVAVRAASGGRFEAALDGTLVAAPEGLTIERTHLGARASDLGAVARMLRVTVPMSGQASVELTAHGKVTREGGPVIAVAGTASGRRIQVAQVSSRAFTVSVDAQDVLGQPRGRLSGRVQDVRIERQPAGTIELDAHTLKDGRIALTTRTRPAQSKWLIDLDALVAVDAERRAATVDLGKYHLRTRGVDWNGQGGRITVDPATARVSGVRMQLAGGRLAVDASVGRQSGEIQARVAMTGVELDALDDAIGPIARGTDWQGTLSLEAEGRGRAGVWHGTVKAAARGIRVRTFGPALDVDLDARVAPGLVALEVHGGAPLVGSADLSVEIDAPRRLDDLRAWQRLDRSAIRKGRLAMDVTLKAWLGRLGAVPWVLDGRVVGELALDGGEPRGAMRITELKVPRVPVPISADLELEPEAFGVTNTRLDVELHGLTRLRAGVALQLPERPFDPAAWAALDTRAVRGASVRVDQLVLNDKSVVLFGLPRPWLGKGTLALDVAPGMASARLVIDGQDIKGGPLVGKGNVHLELSIDDQGTVLAARAGLGGKWLMTVDGQSPVTMRGLWREGLAGLEDMPLTARLDVPRTALGPIWQAFGVAQPIDGTMALRVDVSGTMRQPKAKAALDVADVGLRGGVTSIRELHATLGYVDGRIDFEASGVEPGDGKLDVTGQANVDDLDQATLAISAHGFELEPLAALAPKRLLGVAGKLDADLRLFGTDPKTARLVGVMRLSKGQLPIDNVIGTLRDASLTFEVKGPVATLALDGKVGRGTMKVEAHGQLEGLLPRSAEIELTVDNMTLINQLQPRIDGRLVTKVRRDGELWRVTAEVDRASVIVGKARGTKLGDTGVPPDMAFIYNGVPAPEEARPESKFHVEMGVRPADPLLIFEIKLASTRVLAPELRTQVSGQVSGRLGYDALWVEGQVSAVGGDVEVFDRRYRIDRANVRLDGGIDPALDIRIVHTFPDMTLWATVTGRLTKPELTLRSDPPTYTEGQLLTFLLGGSPGAAPGNETRDAATAVASSLVSQRIKGYIGHYLPVKLDVMQFEAATASESAAFTIGKWLTAKLFVAYRRRTEAQPDQNAGEAQLEYWLRQDTFLQGVAGDRGVHGLDLMWMKRW